MTAALLISDLRTASFDGGREPGDTASSRERVNTIRTSLVRFVESRVRDLDLAEDIVQDVFFNLLRTANADEVIEDAGAWLYRAAKNRIIDWQRKHKTERLTPFMEETAQAESSPMRDLISSEAWDAFVDALAELPSQQRDIFVMNEMQGISFREISEITGEKLNTLLARKHRAVKTLREKLARFEHEFKD